MVKVVVVGVNFGKLYFFYSGYKVIWLGLVLEVIDKFVEG